MAHRRETFRQLLYAVLGSPKDDDRSGVTLEQSVQGVEAIRVAHMEQAVLERRLGVGLDPHAKWILEMLLDHGADPGRHGRRCQHRLTPAGHRDDLLDIAREAGVQHLVSLVENQVIDTRQVQKATFDPIKRPARRADDDLWACAQLARLPSVWHAAVEQGRPDLSIETAKDRRDLDRQLSRRRDDEALGQARAGLETVEQGQQEGEGLA